MNGSDSKSWTTEEPLEVLLNTDVLWDIDLKFGGTDGEIDLSSLKVEEFELDGGAGISSLYWETDTLQQKLILMPGLPILKYLYLRTRVSKLRLMDC